MNIKIVHNGMKCFHVCRRVLFLFALGISMLKVSAQPIFLSNIYENPSNYYEFEISNKYIARAYAPILHQFINSSSAHSADGRADYPVRVNYDGNWDHLDNWENAGQIYEDTESPVAYFSVAWTENFWIITYSYYYTRDFSYFQCASFDEHEGDLPRVVVVVERATYLIRAFFTTHHGENDIETCINYNNWAVGVCPLYINEGEGFYLGNHPYVYCSSGSHAIYSDYTKALEDGNNPCNPPVLNEIKYFPGTPPVFYTTGTSVCENLTFYTGRYELLDVFMHYEGLWDRRPGGLSSAVSNLFTSTNVENQKFLCDNFVCSKAASAPWNGSMGMNPAKWIMEDLGVESFNCDCEYGLSCDEIEFHECQYIFNKYMCDVYKIEMPDYFDYNGAWVKNPHQDVNTNSLIVVFTLSAFDGYTGTPTNVTWNFTPPSGVNAICTGCSSGPNGPAANRITLELENTTIDDILANPQAYSLTVTANFIECGQITKGYNFQEIDNFVTTGTNCQKLILEVNEDYHIDGNQYTWNFPMYGTLATITNNGRRVEFPTETVIAQTSETTNPERVLDYQLTVSNDSVDADLNITGNMKIPQCEYDGLSMMIYPNPANATGITLSFEGVEEEQLEIHILDFQYNRLRKDIFTRGQKIDISTLDNGLYYLYTITKNGRILTEKLCISRH